MWKFTLILLVAGMVTALPPPLTRDMSMEITSSENLEHIEGSGITYEDISEQNDNDRLAEIFTTPRRDAVDFEATETNEDISEHKLEEMDKIQEKVVELKRLLAELFTTLKPNAVDVQVGIDNENMAHHALNQIPMK